MSDRGLSRIAFASIVAGVGALLVAVVWGGWHYQGYDHARQYISELGATGAPTGGVVSQWGFVPNGLLVTVFFIMAAWILRRSALAVVACILLAMNGIGMTGAGVYPCDFECSRADPSPAAMLHDLFAVLGYLCAILGVLLLSLWAAISRARWLAAIGFVALAANIVGFPAIVAEVELVGLYQRGMETTLGLFMLAFGWSLMNSLRPAAAPT
ncbi:DUF998 domain-containing protein [Brevundimonas lutea]|uniref:DUF998 domain-containing protein n=1 Tax=Brevundimonas lutea TaxID=2293980 RepID=UPI000F038C46|nr:DUF998 domain-containing protein [Brevundimonas lutea]